MPFNWVTLRNLKTENGVVVRRCSKKIRKQKIKNKKVKEYVIDWLDQNFLSWHIEYASTNMKSFQTCLKICWKNFCSQHMEFASTDLLAVKDLLSNKKILFNQKIESHLLISKQIKTCNETSSASRLNLYLLMSQDLKLYWRKRTCSTFSARKLKL